MTAGMLGPLFVETLLPTFHEGIQKSLGFIELHATLSITTFIGLDGMGEQNSVGILIL